MIAKKLLASALTLAIATTTFNINLNHKNEVYAFDKTAIQMQNVSQNMTDDIGLVGNLFCIGNSNEANHAALQWDTTIDVSKFVLYRSTNANNGFYPIYEGTGNSFEDDNMQIGQEYYYQLKASNGSNDWYSHVVSLKPCQISDSLNTYDNQKGSNLVYETSGTKIGNKYYSYSLKTNSGEAYLVERTSSDGINFSEERIVADKSQNSDLSSCKIESVQMKYMEKTGQMVIWAHWEKKDGYSDGKALVITGTPGGNFKVHHIYNPLNIQVRDMTIFVDDDQTGYLIAASNEQGQSANATIYIFKMNDSYDDITEVVKKVHENKYREFPNMIKKDGYYYLFTSQTAGWYPSAGGYSVTKDLYGNWSDLRSIGNNSTFSSQSGWIVNMKDKNYLMHAYRWLKASGTSGTTLCPIYFANGFAFYDYYPSFKYSTKTGEVYPVQTGKLLSQDKQSCASISAKTETNAEKAFDGSYKTSFTASEKKWPYYLQTDLGEVCDLSNIQTSWYICKGSEGYYTYSVEGSLDGTNWTTLLDRTNKNDEIVNKTYGFNSDMLSGKARYVRLNVKNATLHNNPNNNWYTPTVFEVKIFGTPTDENKISKPLAEYNFEQNGDILDLSGNGNKFSLYGNAKIEYDSEKGNVLSLDGSNGTYAKLPNGLLDGCKDFTVSMDIKSLSTGDFFIFATGKDENKYAFFKVGQQQFKFAISQDTWKGESGIKYNMSGNSWHNYTLVVNGKTAKMYLDGNLVCQSSELTTSLSDLGENLECLIGKSFYSADDYFKGSIDNIKIYKTALNKEEITQSNQPDDSKDESSSEEASSSKNESSSEEESSSKDESSSQPDDSSDISIDDSIVIIDDYPQFDGGTWGTKEYTFTVPTTGKYKLTMEFQGNASAFFKMKLDGVENNPWKEGNWVGDAFGGNEWSAFGTKEAIVELTAGTHTITVEGNEYAKYGICSYAPVEDVHKHSYTSKVTTPATCTENGVMTYTCSCGDSYTEVIKATGHSFGAWTTTKAATCEVDGVQTRTCAKCGEKETKVIPATGHKYVTTTVAPTTTDKGYDLHTCSVCGDSYKDNYTDPVQGQTKLPVQKLVAQKNGETQSIRFLATIKSDDLIAANSGYIKVTNVTTGKVVYNKPITAGYNNYVKGGEKISAPEGSVFLMTSILKGVNNGEKLTVEMFLDNYDLPRTATLTIRY